LFYEIEKCCVAAPLRGPLLIGRRAGEGMRLGSLKGKYPKEYGELRAERRGQQEVL
jgi:hypothetical protein